MGKSALSVFVCLAPGPDRCPNSEFLGERLKPSDKLMRGSNLHQWLKFKISLLELS